VSQIIYWLTILAALWWS